MNCIGKMKTYTSSELHESFVSIGFECLDRNMFDPEKCYELLGKSGIKHARVQTGWAKTESIKGRFDFSWLDSIVDNLLNVGVEPWFNVGFGNPLYMNNVPNEAAVGCVPMLFGQSAVVAWENYVKELAMHFAGRIEYFEIWNEPDQKHFWYPGDINATEYGKMVSSTGKIIKSCIPNAKIGGCISTISDFMYIDEFAKEVSKTGLDFFAYHAYKMLPEDLYFESVAKIRDIFDKYGLVETELWQGEAGYPSWFPKNHWLHPTGEGSEHQQAVWQLRRYFIDRTANNALSSFFQMVDMWEKPYQKAVETINRPAAHGVLNGISYTPKKSYETLSRLSTFFSDTHATRNAFTAEIPGYNDKIMTLSFEKRNKPIYSYYLPINIELETPVKEGLCLTIKDGSKLDSPVLVDMYTGNVFEITDVCKLSNGGVRIHNLPYGDYPMVICNNDAFETEDNQCL